MSDAAQRINWRLKAEFEVAEIEAQDPEAIRPNWCEGYRDGLRFALKVVKEEMHE